MAGLVAIRQRENAFRDKYERYLRATPFDADRKRKALTAVAAKMARVAFAVVKHGSDYQCFFEHRIPSGSIPLARAVEAVSTSYGLENFDLLGRWRADYGPDPIDASGAMVDGTTFNGPVELRTALLARSDAFLNTMTERLLAYSIDGKQGIGKPTPALRMPAVRAALREAEAQNYSWSSLIAAIVKAPSDLH
jgi:hypothetical protein